MTEITIECCVPCSLREHAVDTQTALLEEFGRGLEGVELQPGHGDIFRVHADGILIWDKDDRGGTIDIPAITDEVRDRIHS